MKSSDGTTSDPTPTFPAGIQRLDAAGPPPETPAPGEILIVTGMSGAGKTLAGGVLQDRGWYVVDNLPPHMIGTLAGMMTPEGSGVQHLAVVVDVRSRHFFETLTAALDALKAADQAYRVIFLDASDQTLVQRYERVRRPHPLQGEGTVLEGLALERDVIAAVRLRADCVIDTTGLSVNEFSGAIDRAVGTEGSASLTMSIVSFGFKHGLPLDANHVADVRFLQNPYWIGELRHLTGLDQPVRDYVLALPEAQGFIDRYAEALHLALAGYIRERKLHVTVAIGCTGGKHRSVVLAEALADAMRPEVTIRTLHRDLGKE